MIQAKMADMYTALNVSRSYTYNVARSLDKGLVISKVRSKHRFKDIKSEKTLSQNIANMWAVECSDSCMILTSRY